MMLLQDNEDLRSKLDAEIATREEQCEEMKDKFEKEIEILNLKLMAEEKQREKERENLQKQIDKLSKEAKDAKEALETQIETEREARILEAKTMDDFFRLDQNVICHWQGNLIKSLFFLEVRMRLGRKIWMMSMNGSKLKMKNGWLKQRLLEQSKYAE